MAETGVRIVIADDSAFMRKLVRSFFDDTPGMQVIGEATDGEDACALAERLRPDVMTMDYRMPRMNGADAVRRIMRMRGKRPAIVMVSAYTKEDAAATLESLRAGAVDYVAKPSGETSLDLVDVRDELIAQVRAAAHARVTVPEIDEPPARRGRPGRAGEPRLVVVIGGSTGAPPLIERILAGLHSSPEVAVLVVQHMPAYFTTVFAEHLNGVAEFPVHLAANGPIRGGEAWVIPGGATTSIVQDAGTQQAAFSVHDSGDDRSSPHIDAVMSSAAAAFGERCVAVVLSGMGSDGAEGAAEVAHRGGIVMIQDPNEAVIGSMPEHVMARTRAERHTVREIVRRLNALISEYA